MRLLHIVIVTLLLSGCSTAWYEGEWRVVGAEFPGISAMGGEEAEQWIGAKAVYSDSVVSFRGESCEEPEFTVESLSEAEFQQHYRATFAGLGIDGTAVEIIGVGCAGSWPQPGATLIRATDDEAYAPWDGVFFKLEKAASE